MHKNDRKHNRLKPDEKWTILAYVIKPDSKLSMYNSNKRPS